MKRGMEGNEVCVKRNKFGKIRKHIRWKGGEFVVVEKVKSRVRVEMVE